jgi:hypothetical protein
MLNLELVLFLMLVLLLLDMVDNENRSRGAMSWGGESPHRRRYLITL